MIPALQKAVQKLRKEQKLWVAGAPTSDWWTAVRQVIDSAADIAGDFPLSLLHWAVPIADMADGWLTHFEPDEDRDQAIPHKALASAVGRLLEAQPKTWPALEECSTLLEQGVSPAQIGKMHGLLPHIAEQIGKGKLPYPERHITPHVIEQRKQQKLMRDRLKLAMSRWSIKRAESEDDLDDDDDDVSVETTAQMLARGATWEEIRAVKTIDDVLAEGIDASTASEIFEVEPESVADEAERMGMEPIAGDVNLEGLDEAGKVKALADAGWERDDIAAELRIPRQRVAAHLRPVDPAKKEKAKTRAKVKRAKARSR